jgi:tetratricopeptide (TPR) repeat protein
VADYLALAIDCEDARARREVDAAEVAARHGGVGLIGFRLALCAMGPNTPARLRAADSRWVDSLFFEGRAEMTRRPIAEVAKAEALFREAREAFPESNAIVLALGAARNALSQYETALGDFDSVISREPQHRDALLGRVMSLSYLERHTEAIATATRIIELGTWLMGDAYYWRAWNRFQLKELDPAGADAEQATKLNIDTSTSRWPASSPTRERSPTRRSIGSIARSPSTPPTARPCGPPLSCTSISKAGRRRRRSLRSPRAATPRQSPLPARTSPPSNRPITPSRSRRHASPRRRSGWKPRGSAGAQSAFNAAQSYLRLGQKAEALSHVDAAAEHEQLREKALVLKASIEKLPQ